MGRRRRRGFAGGRVTDKSRSPVLAPSSISRWQTVSDADTPPRFAAGSTTFASSTRFARSHQVYAALEEKATAAGPMMDQSERFPENVRRNRGLKAVPEVQ